jgi:parallel beta-helix repeat protein
MLKKIICGAFLALLLVGTLSLRVNIPLVNAWNGTVTIQADGNIDPSTAPIQRNGDIYTLTDNIISTSDGIVIERDNMTINANGHTIQGGSSGNGIVLAGTNNVTVENANIQGFSVGIFAPSSNYDKIAGNNIQQNSAFGIWLDGSSNNNIVGNTIQQNAAYGIWLSSSSNNNIYHDNFANNTQQIYSTYDSYNVWNNSYPLGGNYWNNYNGTDSNKDGIGDTPYIIDNNNIDNYPLMHPWKLGDANYDGKVNVLDLITVAIALGAHPGDQKWNIRADLNQDGRINVLDLIIVATCLGT